MQQLSWLDVQLVLTLSRTQSLRSAGSALGLDVSTLSRRLAALERRVDGQLFDRSRSGIVATPMARALLPAAQAMERASFDFERSVEGFERDIEGVVRVSMTPSVGELFLPELFRGLSEAHPRLEVVLHVSDEVVDLERRQADLGLRFVRPLRGELSSRRLARLPHRIVASPSLVAKLGQVARWEAVPWVLPVAGPVARAVSALGARRPLLSTDSIPAQLSAVRAGMAAAVLPSFFCEHFGLAPLRLARGLREPVWPEVDVWLVAHEAQRRVPRVAAVARWLTERVPRILAAGGLAPRVA
jgi:DNA-binding transcriptional LysR family regulator